MPIGIIYATNSKMVRRVIATDNLAVLNDPKLVSKDETILVIDGNAMTHISQADDIVTQATGKVPANFRCAVVAQDGSISHFIKADPTIDALPNVALVAVTPEIDQTATYDAVQKMFTIPAKTIPAGIGKDGNPVPRQDIPAKQVPAVDPVAVIGAAVATQDVLEK